MKYYLTILEYLLSNHLLCLIFYYNINICNILLKFLYFIINQVQYLRVTDKYYN